MTTENNNNNNNNVALINQATLPTQKNEATSQVNLELIKAIQIVMQNPDILKSLQNNNNINSDIHNKPITNPFDEYKKGKEMEKIQKEMTEKVSNYYADVCFNLKNNITDAENLIGKVNGKLEDKVNILAKELILKAFENEDNILAVIKNFDNQNVYDDTTAFNMKYKLALDVLGKKTQQENIGFLKNPNGIRYSQEDLKKLYDDLFDSTKREGAEKILNSLN